MAEHETARAQIGIVRRGYVIVVLIGILALGIPLAGVFVRDLPDRLRPFAWIGLLAVAVGFVWFAVSLARSGEASPLLSTPPPDLLITVTRRSASAPTSPRGARDSSRA